jgi:hypothetical protein
MELRKKLYTPAWRDPKLLRAERRGRALRPFMGLLITLCLFCLFLPDKQNYSRAISMQLADGGLSARALFALMGVTLVYFAARLWQWGNRLSAYTASFILLALALIAFTDPRSGIHNGAFVTLAIGLCSIHAGVFYKDLDGRLFFPTLGALAGLAICPFNLGVGERVLVASTCLALYLLYYGELDP